MELFPVDKGKVEKFDNFEHYTNAASANEKFVEYEIWDDFKAWAEDHVDFLEAGLDNIKISHAHCQLMDMYSDKFVGTVDQTWGPALLLEILKLTVPTSADTCAQPHVWTLGPNNRELVKAPLTKLCCAPMGGSAVYSAKAKAKATPKATPKPKATPASKSTSKRNASESPGGASNPSKRLRRTKGMSMQTADSIPEEALVVSTPAGRDKYFLDDLLAVILTPVKVLPTEDLNREEVLRRMRLALCFMVSGGVCVKGNSSIQQWPVLRKELRLVIVQAHLQKLVAIVGASNAQAAMPSASEHPQETGSA